MPRKTCTELLSFGESYWFASIFYIGICLLMFALTPTWLLYPHRVANSAPLVCELPEHDFGEISSVDSPEHRFVLVNRGKESVRIRDVTAGCGSCVHVVDYTKTLILPGNEGFVTLQLLAGLQEEGKVSKGVIVISDNPIIPPLLLILNADILPNNNETEQ